MRLRNMPGSREVFEASPYAVTDIAAARGHWREIFQGRRPLLAELGCGKGRFVTELAAARPDAGFIGIDKYTSVIYKGLKRLEGAEAPENLRFVCLYASSIEEVFAEGELDGLYLNFSDPWPKKRHADRRLTSRRYLSVYQKILAPGGFLEFKTDGTELFDFSLEELKEAGWTAAEVTRDLHALYAQTGAEADLLLRTRVMTEYEERFVSEGKPICKLVAFPPDPAR